MSVRSEVPAAFHNAAGSRGPIALVGEGISDVRSRRRLVRYLTQADIKKRFFDSGVEVIANSPEQFAAVIKSEVTKWRNLIRDSGIRAD